MEFVVLVGLVLTNAFLSLSEIAVLTARTHRLTERAERGDAGAATALRLRANPSRFLATIQVGITLVGLLAGAVSGATLGARFGARLEGAPVIGAFGTEIGVFATVLVVTYVWVVFGELVPKRVALAYPDAIAVHVSVALKYLDRMARWPIEVLVSSTRMVARGFGVRRVDEPSATPEEIAALAALGEEAGSIHPMQREMVERVLRMRSRPAAEIMTPRSDLAALTVGDTEAAVRTIAATGHSRYPVFRGDADVVGMVRTADLFVQQHGGFPPDIRGAMQAPVFVPEVATIVQVVDRMRRSGTHAVVVVDEQGGARGLITAHDLLEAVVGELPAPGEGDYAELVPRRDGSWLADGALPVEELRATLGLADFPGEELRHCDTVAGLVMASLGRVPITGDRFPCAGVSMEVLDMDGRRVDKVLVERPRPPATAPD